MKITDALTAEHLFLRSVFDHIERVLPDLDALSEVRLLTSLLERLLLAHGRTEDQLVLPALDHTLAEKGQRDRLCQDHLEIDDRLRQAHVARELSEAQRLLKEVLRASRNHFAREERTAFPLAEKVLSVETLTRLGKAWMTLRKKPIRAT